MVMASNVNRVATANTLNATLDALLRVAGLVVQTHRAYESPSKDARGLLQREVARMAGVSKAVVSKLERGVKTPGDKVLRAVLRASGFQTAPGTAGEALFEVLRAIRVHGRALRRPGSIHRVRAGTVPLGPRRRLECPVAACWPSRESSSP